MRRYTHICARITKVSVDMGLRLVMCLTHAYRISSLVYHTTATERAEADVSSTKYLTQPSFC